MKSALHKGNWYLVGGVDQYREVFYTSLKSLIATTQSAGAEHASVWNALPHLPFPFSSPVMFNDQLITVGEDTAVAQLFMLTPILPSHGCMQGTYLLSVNPPAP